MCNVQILDTVSPCHHAIFHTYIEDHLKKVLSESICPNHWLQPLASDIIIYCLTVYIDSHEGDFKCLQ